jgi:hypothetical protein
VRKSLNDNPVVAIAVIAVLGLVVAFMLLHALSSRSTGGSSSPATTTTASPDVAATAPATAGTVSPAVPAGTAPATAPAVGEFKAGPGLPAGVVDAYDSGKVVALVVLKKNGIDDNDIALAVAPLRKIPDVALFTTPASKVARYARITEGVDLNRVPAIVIIRPKKLTDGSTPVASVSYGFKSVQGVVQTLRDATYKGPENLPSYPR